MSSALPSDPAARFYSLPESVAEALAAARSCAGEYRYSAGGTDLQVLRGQGLHDPAMVIDLSCIRDLRELRFQDSALDIGALVTLDELISNLRVRQAYPLLLEAALSVATPVIRKTATVGGNLLVSNRCINYNQSRSWRAAVGSCLRDVGDTCLVTGVRHGKCFSRHVSDLAPVLLALDAAVTIRNQNSTFSIPLSKLYVQDGIRFLSHLEHDGILLSIRVAATTKHCYYRKLRLRQSLDFASLSVAACVDAAGVVRICLNGIAMAPVLITGTWSDLSLPDLIKRARLKSKLVDNDLLPMAYRQEMLAVYLEELWHVFHGQRPESNR
ncbi:FAD binding domain-containing protein [candidate division KSB1 bacterium]|nr:FAD binding domain-containing protein [candidate division KSB1 bacterium]